MSILVKLVLSHILHGMLATLKTYLLPLLLLFLTFSRLCAQELSSLYYDSNWNKCGEKVAFYKKTTYSQAHDSVFYVKIYKIDRDGLLQDDERLLMEGSYSSIVLGIEEGVFHFYHIGSSHESYTGAYTSGRMTGIWKTFNKKNQLIRTLNYDLDSTHRPPNPSSRTTTWDTTQPLKEEMPSFGNGQGFNAMQEYVRTHIHYPPMAWLLKIQGKARIGFVVERDGSLTSFEVLDATYKDLGAEALRMASTMPPWLPGKINGTPVHVKMTIPIKFSLP